ncbi:MAG: HlyC/CorC family transporter [Desulfovibrionaceae bacterium]|nr:HlyC/CorC family transporter [Desulfovibrionaceae bacterium]
MDDSNDTHSSLWTSITKLFGRDRDNDEKLEQAILDASEDGEVEPQEKSMLLGILRFNDLQVHDTMIPRTDMDCIPIDSSLAECAALIVSSGHSRIPVYRDTRDNIVGMVHAKDILPYFDHDDRKTLTVAAIMREPFFVPDTKSTRTLLQEFRERKQHIAIALDEYGGTSGLITIEDVLEEIVGDIEDEHDAPKEEDIRPLESNIYELTGRATLEDLTELGLDLENDEVDTIGGYLCMQAGHVPATGESFILNGWRITVLDADPKLIHKLRLEPANLEPHADPASNA